MAGSIPARGVLGSRQFPEWLFYRIFSMRLLLSVLCLGCALHAAAPAPAQTDVSYTVEGRFGVSSVQGPGGSRTQALYETSFTTRFSHQTDNGMRFNFDLGVVMGNLPDTGRPRPGPRAPAAVGVSLGSD